MKWLGFPQYRMDRMSVTTMATILILLIRYANAERWTEEDEAKRIQQLKEAEQLEFELEQQSQPDRRVLESVLPNTAHRLSLVQADTRDNEQIAILYGKRPTKQDRAIASPLRAAFRSVPTTTTPPSIASNWCYHCASPLNRVSPDMRRAIERFLMLRRTIYPSDVISMECTEPRNLSNLAKEECLHSYCQTLILTDHDAGSAFTIRGCAERFGAINEKMLQARGDNTCARLHDTLDIQECICRYRKYCYGGSERSFFFSSAQPLDMLRPFTLIAFIIIILQVHL